MEILLHIMFLPVAGILKGTAGILWPSEDSTVRRLQRVCLAILLAGIAFALSASIVSYVAPSWHVLTLVILSSICFIGAGMIGDTIEGICKVTRPPNTEQENASKRESGMNGSD